MKLHSLKPVKPLRTLKPLKNEISWNEKIKITIRQYEKNLKKKKLETKKNDCKCVDCSCQNYFNQFVKRNELIEKSNEIGTSNSKTTKKMYHMSVAKLKNDYYKIKKDNFKRNLRLSTSRCTYNFYPSIIIKSKEKNVLKCLVDTVFDNYMKSGEMYNNLLIESNITVKKKKLTIIDTHTDVFNEDSCKMNSNRLPQLNNTPNINAARRAFYKRLQYIHDTQLSSINCIKFEHLICHYLSIINSNSTNYWNRKSCVKNLILNFPEKDIKIPQHLVVLNYLLQIKMFISQNFHVPTNELHVKLLNYQFYKNKWGYLHDSFSTNCLKILVVNRAIFQCDVKDSFSNVELKRISQKINKIQVQILYFAPRTETKPENDKSIHSKINPINLAIFDCVYSQGHVLSVKALNIDKLPKIPIIADNLIYLNISYNHFQEIPDQIYQCKNLKYLYARNNPINKVPEKIKILKDLLVLSMPYCLIKIIHCNLGSLKLLEQLDLSYNFIDNFDIAMDKMMNLKKLDLTGNKILWYPAGLRFLPLLQTLKIDPHHKYPLLSIRPINFKKLKELELIDENKTNQLFFEK
ncbi:hypothetical protein A3Q56_04502 [Intoshia linei]|uniref:Leucine-rich repeat protein n=1 Tax=Intoshia linei TaxID=1819745 RepID=A0A177B0N8_9BILA|nr:hypothetical protein A3Q56_04502 [Intoshia linei]